MIQSRNDKKITFGSIREPLAMPNLVEIQTQSYRWFLQPDAKKPLVQGLEETFREIFPIEDATRKVTISYLEYTLGQPVHEELECLERGITYSRPLRIKVQMKREGGEVMEQTVYLGDLPEMTARGTFIINGAERVVVSQIQRSPGLYFDFQSALETTVGVAIPYRGSWLQFEADAKNTLGVRLDRRRKVPATMFLRILGYETNEQILTLFHDLKEVAVTTESALDRVLAEDIVDRETGEVLYACPQKIAPELIDYLRKHDIDKIKIIDDRSEFSRIVINTLEKDDSRTAREAVEKVHHYLRPGDLYTYEGAKREIDKLYFDPRHYDLGRVGRYKLNEATGLDIPLTTRILTKEDIIAALRLLIEVNSGRRKPDDIDHLGNRRVRPVGELLQNQFRVGLIRMERIIRDKLANTQELETLTPQTLINPKPVIGVINEFFGSSQLSQFMDQTNPLAALTHQRRLSALGPGGLSRERAGFEVRDVHYTHYGRICPIETPEGPNIGLIVSLACYARVNELGFIETPYRTVSEGRSTDTVTYYQADREDPLRVAQANAPLDKDGRFTDKTVAVRYQDNYPVVKPDKIDLMDVTPKQLVSISAALIPFLEHDDANRALMGANMQRQAVPLLLPQAPIVGTGVERTVAVDSGVVVVAPHAGRVVSVSAEKVIIQTDRTYSEDQFDLDTGELTASKGDAVYDTLRLRKFKRTNQGTCMTQRPIVSVGQKVAAGDVVADGPATDQGELALGRNVLVAFMPWKGYNFEDAIVLSRRLVEADAFTSIHIEEFECVARETKLGPEEITRDIPNAGQDALALLDHNGIALVGAHVKSHDILVGKVTPRSSKELAPEYKLLHSIFGEKAKKVRDTSLRVPHGIEGTVIDVREFSRNKNDQTLGPGVLKMVKVFVAIKRKIAEGDKMAGRHGNKGVISRIVPVEDMPYLADGTPVDIVLNPLGVPSRMNLGQVLEAHLGWAARELGLRVVTPVFDGATEAEIDGVVKEAQQRNRVVGHKVQVFDSETGEPFDQKIVVGCTYMLKLNHLVDEKIHARSIGPYSLVTQQPLGGKAQFGGQRLGEMEVWALEAYGAAHILQEMLTVKSDDVAGRAKVYEAIVKGEEMAEPGIPESFNVLVHELQGLALDLGIFDGAGAAIDLKELDDDPLPRRGTDGE